VSLVGHISVADAEGDLVLVFVDVCMELVLVDVRSEEVGARMHRHAFLMSEGA